jgi:polygalacturonase
VTVPAGTFLTGAIRLLSNVDLHLEQGAVIRFSQDPAAYLPVVPTRWQGIELMNYSPFVYCYGQRNVAITGQGTLDGQADASHWWTWKSLETPDFTALEAMADAGTPVSQRVFAVAGVTVSSTGPNTDGCDPESCDGVLIDSVTFNAGDDCIAIKSGRDTDGRRVGVPCQNVVVQRCTFANGHGGITVGSELSGGVRNVYARDLTMNSPGLQSGHRVKANSLRGGYVRSTNVYRVQAGTIGGPLLKIEGSYSGQTGDFPPTLTGITLNHWTVDSCQSVWAIAGTSASDPVGTVTLADITVTTATGASSAQYVSDLVVDDVTVGGVPVTG